MFRGHTPLKIYNHCLRYLQSFSTQRSRQSLLFNSTLRTTIAPTVQDPKEDPTVQDPTVQGDRTTTRFKRQPAAPIHPHHSIAKDSEHTAGNGERRRQFSSPKGLVHSTRLITFLFCFVPRRWHDSRTEKLHGGHRTFNETRCPLAALLNNTDATCSSHSLIVF